MGALMHKKKFIFPNRDALIYEYAEYGYVEVVQYMVNQESSKLF